jgi:AraC-like DNA-binding protein
LIYKLFHTLNLQAKKRNLSPNTDLNWVEKSKQYMHTHYTENISVKDVANYIGFHRSHFTSSFVNEVGISPIKYLLKLKMEKASKLLSKDTYTITEIAYSLGYSDLYSFSRAFKNYYGSSPKQYEKTKNMTSKKGR